MLPLSLLIMRIVTLFSINIALAVFGSLALCALLPAAQATCEVGCTCGIPGCTCGDTGVCSDNGGSSGGAYVSPDGKDIYGPAAPSSGRMTPGEIPSSAGGNWPGPKTSGENPNSIGGTWPGGMTPEVNPNSVGGTWPGEMTPEVNPTSASGTWPGGMTPEVSPNLPGGTWVSPNSANTYSPGYSAASEDNLPYAINTESGTLTRNMGPNGLKNYLQNSGYQRTDNPNIPGSVNFYAQGGSNPAHATVTLGDGSQIGMGDKVVITPPGEIPTPSETSVSGAGEPASAWDTILSKTNAGGFTNTGLGTAAPYVHTETWSPGEPVSVGTANDPQIQTWTTPNTHIGSAKNLGASGNNPNAWNCYGFAAMFSSMNVFPGAR